MIDEFLKRFGDYAAYQGKTWRLKNPELMDAYQAASEQQTRQFRIGPLTMERIFKANGMVNMYDLQRVLDCVEVELEKKLLDPKGVYNLGVEEAAQMVDEVWRRHRGAMNCTTLCAAVRSLLNADDDIPEFVKVVPVPAAIKEQAEKESLLAELVPMATELKNQDGHPLKDPDVAARLEYVGTMNDDQETARAAYDGATEIRKLRAEIGAMAKLLHGMPPQNGSLVARLGALVERAAEMESRGTVLGVGKWEFALGDRVCKPKGAWWEGKVVGFYSTAQTPRGYAVQLQTRDDNGPVQIYPEDALELRP